MRDALPTVPRLLAGASSISAVPSGPDRVPAAAAGSATADRDQSMRLLSTLATVPVWRTSVEGGAAQGGRRHITGAARVTSSGAGLVAPAEKPACDTVSLADGTRITFGAVGEIPVLELA